MKKVRQGQSVMNKTGRASVRNPRSFSLEFRKQAVEELLSGKAVLPRSAAGTISTKRALPLAEAVQLGLV